MMRKVNNVRLLTILAIPALVSIGLAFRWWQEAQNAKEIDAYLARSTPQGEQGVVTTRVSGLMPAAATTRVVAAAADLILLARVQSVGEPYRDEHGAVYHRVVLATERPLKGTPEPVSVNQLSVQVGGGKIGNEYYWVEDAPTYTAGERVLVYLSRNGDIYYTTYEAFGKLTVLEDGSVEGINAEEGYFRKPLAKYEQKLEMIAAE